MKSLWNFVKTTALGGVVFLLPLVLVVALVSKAYEMMKPIGGALAEVFPVGPVGGHLYADILAVLVLLLVSLLAGLVAKSSLFDGFYKMLDNIMMQLIPGYAWAKGITGSMSDAEVEQVFKPVLAKMDDQAVIGFEVERSSRGLVTVFLPGAPDPQSGTVAYFTADRIEPIDASFKVVAKSMKTLGRGSGPLISGQGATEAQPTGQS